MTSANRPGKGARIKVEPIRSLVAIGHIKQRLATRPRDSLLFTLGINTPLRVSDLLALKFIYFNNIKPGDAISVQEKRTGRRIRISLNRVSCEAINRLVGNQGATRTESSWEERHLFQSRRGKVLLASSVHRLVKSWCHHADLVGNYGANSLRKTWGYHQFATFGTDLGRLMRIFNHTTRRQTLDYLCLQPQDFKNIFDHEL